MADLKLKDLYFQGRAMGQPVSKFKRQSNSNQEIKDLLVQNSIVSRKQLYELQKKLKGETFEEMVSYLIDQGDLTETELLSFLSEQYGCQVIEIENFTIPDELTNLIPHKFCLKHKVIPVSRVGEAIIVACTNPTDLMVKEQLMFFTNHKIEYVLASKEDIESAIELKYEQVDDMMHLIYSEIESSKDKLVYGTKNQNKEEEEEDRYAVIKINKNDPEPIIRCVNQIITTGLQKGCSDIHIESYEKTCRIRYRVDGKLQELFNPPKSISSFIISRFKVMSQLDIGEKRKPQDGRIKVIFKNKEIDFRVSVAPTVSGEKIVLRILDKKGLNVDIKNLGMTIREENIFLETLKSPQGMVIVCGPTGSGKTTTIYSGLKILNTENRNISTAEEPVEYKIEGLNQVQVFPRIGLTFASALKSFLRQDPDVIFVGEIRDMEEAGTAFKAASTGHLVLSTIHTNDTPSVITRLLDIGIPNYSIADSISLIVGQRLLRKVCQRCVVEDKILTKDLKILGLTDEQIELSKRKLKKGVGCRACFNTGYKGRVAVFEMLRITDNLKTEIFKNSSALDLKKKAIASGDLVTVRQNGIQKLLEGLTTFEEVMYGTIGDSR